MQTIFSGWVTQGANLALSSAMKCEAAAPLGETLQPSQIVRASEHGADAGWRVFLQRLLGGDDVKNAAFGPEPQACADPALKAAEGHCLGKVPPFPTGRGTLGSRMRALRVEAHACQRRATREACGLEKRPACLLHPWPPNF